MIEIIFFGRGGQGAVTAAQVLATAAFREGKYAQAFPSFGPERRGAPVTAFARVGERRIVDRSQIIKADYVIVLDPNVLKTSNPLNGLKTGGCAIINTDQSPEQIYQSSSEQTITLYCVNASAISEEIYGIKAIPITNIAMLGAFASVSGAIKMDKIINAIDHFFSGEQGEDAKKTAMEAYVLMEGVKN